MPTKINNIDNLFLELAETLLNIDSRYNNSIWDLDLPLLKLCYMIDDYEALFDE